MWAGRAYILITSVIPGTNIFVSKGLYLVFPTCPFPSVRYMLQSLYHTLIHCCVSVLTVCQQFQCSIIFNERLDDAV